MFSVPTLLSPILLVLLFGAPIAYGQLAWRAVGLDDGQAARHILWPLATGVVSGLLAVWGYRRDNGEQFG